MTEVNDLFKVHMLNSVGKEKAQGLADAFSELVDTVEAIVPAGRELALVKTKLEEALFFAKKAMAMDPANQEAAV